MKIFRTDPIAALAAEQTIRANIADQIAELDRKRSELLLSDDAAVVDRHDTEVARLRRADQIHLERIEVLEQACHNTHLQDKERRKTEALAAFEKGLRARVEAAERVDKAVAEFGAALTAYEAAVAAPFFDWPAALFPPLREFWEYSRSNLVARLASDEVLAIKGAAPIRLREIAQRLGPIAERDIAFAASLVESVRTAPLPNSREELAA
jgi:hypothetical protein